MATCESMEQVEMTDPGFRGLSLKKELYDALFKEYEKQYQGKKVKPSFSAWVSQILWDYLEKK
jgi:hypothetical protein